MASRLFDDDPGLQDEPLDDDADDDVTYEDDHPVVDDDADADEVEQVADADEATETQEAPDLDDDIADEEPEPEELAEQTIPAVRHTRTVPLRSLRVEYKDWKNPRILSGLGEEELRPLADSIVRGTVGSAEGAVAGLTDPMRVVQVRHNGDILNVIIDGQRRYHALELAFGKVGKLSGGDVYVPVTDIEPEPVEWSPALAAKCLAIALETESTRAGLSSFERSESAARLRAMKDPDTGKDYTLARIAQVIGRSESWVSKILSARESASATLLSNWQAGKVTEEQFRELSALKGAEQRKATAAVADAREAGDKGAARATAKEAAAVNKRATAAAEAKPEPATAKDKRGKVKGPTVKGPQQEMPPAPPRKPPPFAVVEDMLGMAEKRPPTHDYVKGLMDGIRWDRGMLDAAAFGKPMRDYLQRQSGQPPAEANPKPKAKSGKGKKR